MQRVAVKWGLQPEPETMRAGLALAILVGTTWTALADSGPVIVIPGRPGVPIVINGIDASYAVVEGDWGLGKGVHVQPTIYGGRPIDPDPRVGHYYPSAGTAPGYGRLEVQPPTNRKLPQPAESYHDSWSAQSTPRPPQPEVPFYPPPVIFAPQTGGAEMPQDFSGPPKDFRRRKPGNVPDQDPPQ
jgi:hypothetical protein